MYIAGVGATSLLIYVIGIPGFEHEKKTTTIKKALCLSFKKKAARKDCGHDIFFLF